MGLWFIIYVYLFGGLTFIPLVIFLFVYLHPKIEDDHEIEADDEVQDSTTPYEKLRASEIDELLKSGLGAYMAGWVTVTQEYLESMNEISSNTQSISESHENKSAYLSLYKLVKNSEEEGDTLSINSSNDDAPNGTNGGTSGATNGRRLSSSSIEPVSSNTTDDNKKLRTLQRKHRFYAVLRHGNLFLYKNEKKTDVKHVIVLSGHVVAIWPRGIPEGQLFTKRTCICILKKDYSRPRRLLEGGNDLDGLKITTWDILNSSENDANGIKPPKGSFFLYCDKNIIKEDWYFALIRATKVVKDVGSGSTSGSSGTVTPKSLGNAAGELLDPSIFAKSLHFKTPDMINLIQTLYSSEGQFQTKWLNAIIGRIFLGLQKTETLKNYLQMKIEKKLTKINKPGFLDEFQIKKLDVGSSAPYFTYPLLKEISPDGTLVLSANVHYHGQLSVQIATKLLVNLGVRLKQREVDVLLSVTIQKLEGRIIIKIKPPPSERIWYSFETEPTMDLKIEPIVSSRQMTYNIITGTIEKNSRKLLEIHWFYLTGMTLCSMILPKKFTEVGFGINWLDLKNQIYHPF